MYRGSEWVTVETFPRPCIFRSQVFAFRARLSRLEKIAAWDGEVFFSSFYFNIGLGWTCVWMGNRAWKNEMEVGYQNF